MKVSESWLTEHAYQMQWYEARDTLLGENGRVQEVLRALTLASACQHKEACWLTNACSGKDTTTVEQARKVFEELGDHPLALCFAWILSGRPRSEVGRSLRRSAELGCALAQASMINNTAGKESFSFANEAALQRERNGYFFLGACYETGMGCEADLEKAKENFRLGAEMGYVAAIDSYGRMMHWLDPQRWHLQGYAAARGFSFSFLGRCFDVIGKLDEVPARAEVIFEIGRALKGHIDAKKKVIFGVGTDFESRAVAANRAVKFFDGQCSAARKAVDAWSIIGRRLKVMKDIRRLIAELIWDARGLANYTLEVHGEKLQHFKAASNVIHHGIVE